MWSHAWLEWKFLKPEKSFCCCQDFTQSFLIPRIRQDTVKFLDKCTETSNNVAILLSLGPLLGEDNRQKHWRELRGGCCSPAPADAQTIFLLQIHSTSNWWNLFRQTQTYRHTHTHRTMSTDRHTHIHIHTYTHTHRTMSDARLTWLQTNQTLSAMLHLSSPVHYTTYLADMRVSYLWFFVSFFRDRVSLCTPPWLSWI